MCSALPLFTQGFSIIMAELGSFFRCEIFFLGRMQMLFHLPHNMFSLMEIFNIKISRGPGNFMSVTTQRAELPALEPVYVCECAAGGAPDNQVHDKEVISAIVIKTYRQPRMTGIFSALLVIPVEYDVKEAGCETKSLYRPLVS